MIDQTSRPARKVGIADHLWETFEDMAQQMGSDRDALINQALFMFARLNGFLEAQPRSEAAVGPVAAAAPVKPVQAAASAAPRPSAPPVLAPAPRAESTPAPARPPVRATPEERASANGLDNDPVRREVAERVLETAAELERLIKGKNSEPPPPADDLVEEDEEPLPEAEDPGLLDEEPLPEEADEEPADDLAEEEEVGALYLVTESGDQEQIVKERFVIGRGKHCDFVINSGKVSREHAVISHEGDDWIIEDLGSSNGTWFNKQRIKRRKIEDGDEYFICSEKIRLLVR
ncbi:FHA domain-containing protein [Myxococcus vastator]|uniref:FHA domain-containing protein n=1 Tax=Myxococcus vastator TaxID=2709664 RepID=UPI0013D7CB00|nr:FHA domain-containing protein [Myxococcus vastator]